MQASAYLAVSDLKRALAHAYSTLLVKADTEWTVASPRCLTFFIMYTLINTDWPGVEACHLFIFPQHTHPLQPSTPAPIAHLSFSFPPSPLRTWMPSIPFLVHLSALIRSFHCPAITPSIWLSRSLASLWFRKGGWHHKKLWRVKERVRKERWGCGGSGLWAGSIIVIHNVAGQGRVIWI